MFKEQCTLPLLFLIEIMGILTWPIGPLYIDFQLEEFVYKLIQAHTYQDAIIVEMEIIPIVLPFMKLILKHLQYFGQSK